VVGLAGAKVRGERVGCEGYSPLDRDESHIPAGVRLATGGVRAGSSEPIAGAAESHSARRGDFAGCGAQRQRAIRSGVGRTGSVSATTRGGVQLHPGEAGVEYGRGWRSVSAGAVYVYLAAKPASVVDDV